MTDNTERVYGKCEKPRAIHHHYTITSVASNTIGISTQSRMANSVRIQLLEFDKENLTLESNLIPNHAQHQSGKELIQESNTDVIANSLYRHRFTAFVYPIISRRIEPSCAYSSALQIPQEFGYRAPERKPGTQSTRASRKWTQSKDSSSST